MFKPNKEELKGILEKHRLWLLGFGEGHRADLRGINLRGVNLEGINFRGVNLEGADFRGVNLRGVNFRGVNLIGVNLWGARGNNHQVKSMHIAEYDIVYTKDRMQIGCENLSIEEWAQATDIDIINMDGRRALIFWRKYKEFIFMAIELSPAE